MERFFVDIKSGVLDKEQLEDAISNYLEQMVYDGLISEATAEEYKITQIGECL